MIRLLIIDDNATFLKVARELLLRHRPGFVVDTASDAENGLLAIRCHHYDVVVSDIRLPEMQGLEVLSECHRIRPDTSVVLITGYGDRELEEQAAASGAYAFLHKPVTPEAFCAVVVRAAVRTRSGRYSDNVPGPDRRWYIQATEQIHRRSEAITAQLLSSLIQNDDDAQKRWAEEQAERIIENFLDYEGSDDLLQLKEEITRALCDAYYTGKTSALTHGLGGTKEVHPDRPP